MNHYHRNFFQQGYNLMGSKQYNRTMDFEYRALSLFQENKVGSNIYMYYIFCSEI